MDKSKFVKLMTVIKERFYDLEGLYEELDNIFGSTEGFFAEQTDLYPIIKVISEICDDTNGWIEWYIYDKQWGENSDLGVIDDENDENDETDNIIPSETLEDLWELIQMK